MAKEVNKINPRKEFFKVDLDEIKAIVNDNYDKTVTFYDEPEALEYRESLKISNDQEA